jgi:hypothetical protein
MRKRYDEGGEVDAEEAANKRTEGMLSNPNAKEFGDAGTSEVSETMPKSVAKPKAAAKPVAKAESKPAPKAASTDVTKMSLAERAKASREKARTGSGTTDTRSVSQRIREKFGMKKGGAVKKMASGGSVGSASKRADGIASRGKTKCKMY